MPFARLLCHALFLCLVFCEQTAHAQTSVAGTDYVVSLIPDMPPSEVKRRWQPVLDQLAHDTGLHFHLHFYADLNSFENGLMPDEVDFAVLSPAQVWMLRSHYRPQLRNGMAMAGIVITQKNSAIKQLGDLRGHSVSLQQGKNIPANLFVQQALREQKIDPDLNVVRSESNALRSVVLGKSDAAIINNYLLQTLPSEIAAQIRVIYRTQELAPPAISSNARLPEEDVRKVKKSLLHLHEAGSPLLDVISMPDPVEADFDRDYSVIGHAMNSEAASESH
ncbi:MAG: PhnD/SsuA/transferrin family substrate-binding protein [bacterium]|nr:PhnD/SsuA/transferrin family substrate-binding protein [bacterium]